MISFISQSINNPWSDKDMVYTEPSHGDKVIYNPRYNSRTLLTDKNIYLCSIKQETNKYQNFYLLAAKQNLFYFIMYVPQMNIYRADSIKDHQLTKQILPKLGLSQKCVSSYNDGCNINETICVFDGTDFLIRVDASIRNFLFPRNGNITDTEILKKFTLMSNTYNKALKEFAAFEHACDTYIDTVKKKKEEKKEKVKNTLWKIGIKKGLMYGVPALLGIPPVHALLDLDSLFDISDVASLADMASLVPSSDIIDIVNSANV